MKISIREGSLALQQFWYDRESKQHLRSNSPAIENYLRIFEWLGDLPHSFVTSVSATSDTWDSFSINNNKLAKRQGTMWFSVLVQTCTWTILDGWLWAQFPSSTSCVTGHNVVVLPGRCRIRLGDRRCNSAACAFFYRCCSFEKRSNVFLKFPSKSQSRVRVFPVA